MIWDWLDVSCKLGIWSAFKLHIENWAVPQPFTSWQKSEQLKDLLLLGSLELGTPSVGNAAKAILEPLLQSFVAYCPSLFEQHHVPCIFQSTLLQFTPPPNVFVILYLQKLRIHSFRLEISTSFWKHIFWTRDFHKPYCLPDWIW
jgi:hypothetical protein